MESDMIIWAALDVMVFHLLKIIVPIEGLIDFSSMILPPSNYRDIHPVNKIGVILHIIHTQQFWIGEKFLQMVIWYPK